MKSKVCTQCKTEKSIEDFYFKTHDNCYHSRCKKCHSSNNSSARSEENRKKKAEYDRFYRKSNKDKIASQKHKWYGENPDKVRASRERNRPKNRKIKNEMDKFKRKIDPVFALTCSLRIRVNDVLRGKNKAGSAVRDLGCSPEFLKIHLESMFYPNPDTGEQMTWSNRGQYGWHVDHKIPLARFDLSKREDFLKACHYTNLQPLWAIDNLKKGDR